MSNSRVTIRLDGADHGFEMERTGRAILDVAAHRNIGLPVQCHVGWCLECRCRVLRGEVRMPEQTLLTAEQRAAGIVLSCCARPVSDEVLLDFDSVE